MSPVLRTVWAMLNLRTMAMFVIACGLLTRVPVGPQVLEPLAAGALGAAIGFLALHMSKVLSVGVWRVLPNGSRTVARAIAGIVCTASLLLGSLIALAAPNLLPAVPFGAVLALFTHLSLLALLLLLGIGRQLPRLFGTLYLAVVATSFAMTTVRFAGIPNFWFAAAAVCAAAWVYASVAGFRAPNYSRRRFAWDLGLETLLARAGRPVRASGSPALTLLRSGRAGPLNLVIAIVVVVLVALMQHATMGRFDTLPLLMFLATPLLGISMFAAFHASHFASNAKRLWLHQARSRAGVFQLVERTAIVDIVIVGTAACAVLTTLAIVRGVAITPIDACKILVAFLGAPIMLVYVGLLSSTAYTGAEKLMAYALGGFCAIEVSGWWMTGLGQAHLGNPEGDANPLTLAFRFALAMSITVALRAFAARRWKRIDWSHYRGSKR